MVKAISGSFVVVATVCALGPPTSTDSEPGSQTSCGAVEGGTVKVVLAYEDAEFSGSGRGVWLSRTGDMFCSGATGEGDALVFVDVPPGQYGVGVATLGIFPPDPILVDVLRGDTVHVEVSARREDAVAECVRFRPGCEQFLAIEVPVWIPNEQRDSFRYWQVALALAGAGGDGSERWIACLRPHPDGALVRALSGLHPNIARADECSLADGGLGRMVHVATGQPARVVTMQFEDRPGGGELWVSYHRGSLDGAWYRCTTSEEGYGRRVGRCVTEAVS